MFRALFFTVYTVPNNSLKPLFIQGDRILVNRCSYGLRTGEDTRFGYSRWIKQNISRGDITAFNYPIDTLGNVSKNPVYVGMCSALPGDTVHLSKDFFLVVPGKNIFVDVNKKNAMLLCNMLRMHEHSESYVCNNLLYVNGRPVKRIKFKKDYYWMSNFGKTLTNDSRSFGFVPEDHVIGRVVMLVYSKDPKQMVFNGFRWERFLKLL